MALTFVRVCGVGDRICVGSVGSGIKGRRGRCHPRGCAQEGERVIVKSRKVVTHCLALVAQPGVSPVAFPVMPILTRPP